MGFERNYQFQIPSKQLNKRSIFTLNLKTELSSWFITGFADVEGYFTIKIQPNVKLKTKWKIRPVFSITLHLKNLSLLKVIKIALDVGKISKSRKKQSHM